MRALIREFGSLSKDGASSAVPADHWGATAPFGFTSKRLSGPNYWSSSFPARPKLRAAASPKPAVLIGLNCVVTVSRDEWFHEMSIEIFERFARRGAYARS